MILSGEARFAYGIGVQCSWIQENKRLPLFKPGGEINHANRFFSNPVCCEKRIILLIAREFYAAQGKSYAFPAQFSPASLTSEQAGQFAFMSNSLLLRFCCCYNIS